MPKYDFAHPQFKNGIVTFPEKKEPLLERFFRLAHLYKINVMRSQMLLSTTKFTGRIFNRMTYIEIRSNGKSVILHNETEMVNFLKDLNENFRHKIR